MKLELKRCWCRLRRAKREGRVLERGTETKQGVERGISIKERGQK